MRILFVGDVFGTAGMEMMRQHSGALLAAHKVDLLIVNCENAADGFGITPILAEELFDLGAHVLTTGNHVWDKVEVADYMKRADQDPRGRGRRLLRPANFPSGLAGVGHCEYVLHFGQRVAVLNLQGRRLMSQDNDNPFHVADVVLKQIKAKVIVIDFHAESTYEKVGLGRYLDGRVTAVLGTHTHVPTADEQILPRGTAYQTDVGMTGPYDGVNGISTELALERLSNGTSVEYQQATGDPRLCATLVECDPLTGKALSIRRILVAEDERQKQPKRK
jgi:metallophosphoesterase (TIGR00282 family)